MYWTTENKAHLVAAVSMGVALPDDIWWEIHADGLQMQASNQADVKRIRSQFPGVIWEKAFDACLRWWNYRGSMAGVPLRIYGCSEAPATCRLVEETYEVTERVPVGGYEERRVTKTRMRAECGDANAD